MQTQKKRRSRRNIAKQKAVNIKPIKRKGVSQKAVPSLTYIGSEGGYSYYRSKTKKRKKS